MTKLKGLAFIIYEIISNTVEYPIARILIYLSPPPPHIAVYVFRVKGWKTPPFPNISPFFREFLVKYGSQLDPIVASPGFEPTPNRLLLVNFSCELSIIMTIYDVCF